MSDEVLYIARKVKRLQVHASLAEYLEGLTHHGPPLVSKSLPAKIEQAKVTEAKRKEAVAKAMEEERKKQLVWIEFEMVGEDGNVFETDTRYIVELPDGTVKEGRMRKGRARFERLEPDTTCKITLPDLDAEFWEML